ncbi:protein stum [Anopheles cruzii]|uniref:protein stum n=1 Tax=Anopheles cruzii TaxID=68878 RepID=UPI0022EC4D5A|nr:protein stum [Anopheles cruzii]
MYGQHDDRSQSSTARASAATSAHRYRYAHQHRHLEGYGSTSTQSSSLENQRSYDQPKQQHQQHQPHSASTASATTTGTTASLFGDPVLPATRHADLLGGEDLYQNLKNNIEQYHAKLYSAQEKQRQAERDALFEQFTSRAVASDRTTYGRTGSAAPGANPIAGSSVTTYDGMPPRRRSIVRTQSAGFAADLGVSRSNLLDMDLLKPNEWIDFTEHEYQHSLIPTNSRTVADVQQLASGNMSRRIENGVFQNPRAAAAARTLRRSSTTDSSLYGVHAGATFSEMANGDRPTFTVLGHGMGYGAGDDDAALPFGGIRDPRSGSASETSSEYERMLRYGRTDPSTAIIRDKINTGSNNRVSDTRQHKNTAFTIISEVLPKSSSFDLIGGGRYSPYRDKHRLASSRILSASSALTGHPQSVGYYDYGSAGYAESGPEDGGSSLYTRLGRRLSHTELSLTPNGLQPGADQRRPPPTKARTSLSLGGSHPGRRQRGVLKVLHKKAEGGAGRQSAKVTITQTADGGRSSVTPTPSESYSASGTATTPDTDLGRIPEHQLRNMKLFGYKPFSSRPPPLSPVPDKGSSMESSQADLKLDAGGAEGAGKKDEKSGGLRAPVFNIRGLLLSPRLRGKSKDASPQKAADGGAVPAVEAAPTGKDEAAPAAPPAAGSPPKKRRFNLARAIIESARRSDPEPEPEPEKPPPQPTKSPRKGKDDRKESLVGSRKAALQRLGIVRSGVRKDSEGNGVKEKRKPAGSAKGKKTPAKGKEAKGKEAKRKPTTGGFGLRGKLRGATGRGRYEDEEDDYDRYDPYEDHDDDERGKKGKKKKPTAGGGGGMLKSALSYAASFRSKKAPPVPDTARGGTAGPGGRPGRPGGKPSVPDKAAGRGQPVGGGTPGSRRRDTAKSAQKEGPRAGTKQSVVVGGRVKSGKGAGPGPTTGSSSRAKSAVGSRGRTLRRSSSALAMETGQQRRMNKLYEKNQKATSGAGGGGGGGGAGSGAVGRSGAKNTSTLVSERKAKEAGGGIAKSDSRGEIRGKGTSGGGDGGTPSFEKRDSDRSLKKSDSNKSLAKMAGGKGGKKSDSKSSLTTKRSDSRSSLYQMAGGGGVGGGDGTDTSGAGELGKSPLNSFVDGAAGGAADVKSARPTPKLQSKGSLLSLLSMKSSRRNVDGGGAQRPDTATTASVATAAEGAIGASSTRLQSASVRGAAAATTATGDPGEGGGVADIGGSKAAGMNERPPSTKPLRRLMSRGSLLSIKSIAHARSFTNLRPPTAGGTAASGGEAADGDRKSAKGAGEGAMGGQAMTKVTEGSQEHDDTTDTEASGGGAGGGDGSMGVATHELTVAGDGEGEKVSNEYNGERLLTSGVGGRRSPMADQRQKQAGSPGPGDNVSSANTESMRDRTTGGQAGGDHGAGTRGSNSDEFEDEDTLKCSKCCSACCAPCWTRTCLPFRRCFRWSGCCGGRLGKRNANGERKPTTTKAKADGAGGTEHTDHRTGCWARLLGCCRRCRNSKTSPETAIVPQRQGAEPGTKKSCWQSLNCCASCRRNKSRELVPRSSIDSDPVDEENRSRCRSCWSKLLCCCRPKDKGKPTTTVKRHRMEEQPVEMETVKCCFCFKRQRPKVKAKPKRKAPVKSTFNCLSCCMMCCRKKGDNQSRRASNFSKKQSIAPTIPPEDLRPKIDMSLVEHSSLMRGAIPVLPICLAYFCLFLNVVAPGTGTVLSGGLCLCIGKPRFSQHDSIKGRIGSFIINCIVGVSQLFTIIFCVVGWGWAIWWGTIMLRLAKQHRKILEMEAAQQEGEDQTTLSDRTGASNPPVALVSKTHRDVETGR